MRLSTAEREHRRNQGLCMYCGQGGHLREVCPKRPSARSSPTEEVSMHVGRIRVTPRGRLSPAEHERRRLHKLCMYCASSAHTVRSCPILRPKMFSSRAPGGVVSPTLGFRVSRITTSQPRTSVARFPVTLSWEGQSLTIPALIDSGADESFVDLQYAQKVGLPVSALQRPLSAFALNGRTMGPVTHRTQPLTLTVSGDHVESIRPYIIHSPDTPFILGRPWLELHTPHVCWSSGRILSWSAACQVCCLQPALTSAQAECSPARVPSRPKGRRRAHAGVPRQSPGGDPWRGGPVTFSSPLPILALRGSQITPLQTSEFQESSQLPLMANLLSWSPSAITSKPTRASPVCSSVPDLHHTMVGTPH